MAYLDVRNIKGGAAMGDSEDRHPLTGVVVSDDGRFSAGAHREETGVLVGAGELLEDTVGKVLGAHAAL